MESPLIELDSENGFFRCDNCKTHIALTGGYFIRDIPLPLYSLGGVGRGFGFEEIVNVMTSEIIEHVPLVEDQPSRNDYLVTDAICKGCYAHLGWLLADVNEAGVSQHDDEGKYLLKRDRLEEVEGKGKGDKIEEVEGKGKGDKIEEVEGKGKGEKIEEVGANQAPESL